jgi:SAM-dependent methyltransferase
MRSTTSMSGSAERWGPLWGARAADWAAAEEQQTPTYEAAIERIGIEAGQRVLEVGCGSGVFLRLAADRGAQVFGLDASDELLALARTRVPEAELRAGDMQFLPYDDDGFDLVAGFNAFFFATDMTAALREAGRVARPGAPVVIQVFGPPERCDLEAMKVIARRFMPGRPPGAPPPPGFWKPGVLEDIAAQAGLDPQTTFDVTYAFEYADAQTLSRRMVAAAGIAAVAGPACEASLREQVVAALAPYRTTGGGYRLRNEYHYLVARAA